jgi:hypothetical protein
MSRFAIAAALCLSACGGSGGGDDGDDDSDAGDSDAGDGDAGPPVNACGFAGDDYLPYAPGYTWTYLVTDIGGNDTGETETKLQRIDPEIDHEDYGAVLVQVTGKLSGETISLTRREGDRVLRFEQEDHDATGALERTTIYQPPQVRIDESPERLEVGATWDETYTETIIDADGQAQIPTTDRVQVLGIDDPCDSPVGEFRCLHVKRTRTAGGVAVKEFLFARGIGKIKEFGANQYEELIDCAVAGE